MNGKALGKGLSALIPEKMESEIPEDSVTHIKTDSIRNNSVQPRTHYDQAKLEELRMSIQEKGILQPILVRQKDDHFEVVAGERRLKAARMLGLAEVPAIVKRFSDQEALVVALIENIQREELSAIEEAEAYRKLIEDFHYTQDTLAESLGKNRSTISNLLRLLKLPENVQTALSDGDISMGHARALLSVESSVEKNRLLEKIISEDLSVRELENLVRGEEKQQIRRERKHKNLDPQIKSVEEMLQRALGTKVRIQAQKKRGKIVVEYYSIDDLERIINLVKK